MLTFYSRMEKLLNFLKIKRRNSLKIKVGNVEIGGDAPNVTGGGTTLSTTTMLLIGGGVILAGVSAYFLLKK